MYVRIGCIKDIRFGIFTHTKNKCIAFKIPIFIAITTILKIVLKIMYA